VRVAILYNLDVYALKALNLLLPHLSGHTIRLFHSSRVGRDTPHRPALLNTLADMEHGLLTRFSNAQSTSSRLGFAELSAHFAVNDHPLNDINQPTGLALLRHFQPDFMVSIRFGKILRADAIACAPKGVINLHSGLLPHYRGVMPTFWAMLAGDPHMGMSLHWVPDPTIDTGTVIAGTYQRCDLSASYVANVWQLYDAGADLIVQAVAAATRGELPPLASSASNTEGAYFTFPDDVSLDAFAKRGLCLFRSTDMQLVD
jgi:methionyl-tRNA formyltransferase